MPAGRAGGLSGSGYVYVKIDRTKHCAHRLAWLYVHGEWPKGDIDHINGGRDDNRIENLRDVPRVVNNENRRKVRRDNKSSGLMGVSWCAATKKWRARIWVRGKEICIGMYDAPETASAAYLKQKRELHEGCTI